MSDYTLAPCSTLICGMQGTGKSTFALRYLLNASAACRFIFDDLGQAAKRLGLPHSSTAAQLEAAIPTRWVVFNPLPMFKGDNAAAFRFFCQWAFDVSRRGPGKKIVFVDEIWQWCSPHAIPRELAILARMGRAEGIELVTASQTPNRIHADLTGQATELICFRLQDPASLDRAEELGAPRADVERLAPGQFIAMNRITGGRTDGRIF